MRLVLATTAASVAIAVVACRRQRQRDAEKLLAAVRTLARYNAWTNDVFLERVASLPDDEVTKPRATLFQSLVHTLNHNFVIEDIFRSHLLGRSHGYTARNTASPPPIASLRTSQREVDDWLIRWADAVTYDELFARRRFKFVGDQEAKGDMSAFEMLVHIINHTTYHRGWAVQMLMEPGNSRPSTTTDLPVYLRDVGRVDPQ
ncbi:hypothetical protein EMIHUDRAFT_113628 [Emiliania huxleyi CCMP1516]|uniref:Damage-inducible protein DinB n=2 Tax=Emiliania huxleyi TaxID=2903 RepID=A0A0D3K1U0_EMIH1|nr:hypothetical protein EMIHUDRAFT_113628 [Emiliania huxleyi CCMP1516]EOD29725.1 hypothetical protein EMIHUDRAFT_113628 [Emiliania huxleyi CCMP1516]|eukprot:XP_005782154.1 hypothetical protein EMIHUDRAFT_113628 [Emiliania huxleyi CCMP1516]